VQDFEYPRVTELDLLVSELMFPILVKDAPTGVTLGYKQLSDLIKERNPNVDAIKTLHHRHIGLRLGTIWSFTKGQGCPHIGSIVVSQSDGECGRGISSIVTDLELERIKVKLFDWSTIEFGFNSYIAKAKVHKKEQETSRKKLSYDEAKTRFFEYWKSIKDEVPLSSTQAKSIRNAMIQHVCDGYFPEEIRRGPARDNAGVGGGRRSRRSARETGNRTDQYREIGISPVKFQMARDRT